MHEKQRDFTESVIVRDYNVPALLQVSPTTAWRYAQSKDYPQKLQLGRNAVGRFRSELLAWLARRKVTSRAGRHDSQ